DDPLPVQGVGTGRPWAFATAIRDWVHRADEPLRAARSAPAAPARAEVDATDGRQRREVGIAVIDDQARAADVTPARLPRLSELTTDRC
ncbi:hypothetical protein BE04_39605, partial [Sorangium cellulosum]